MWWAIADKAGKALRKETKGRANRRFVTLMGVDKAPRTGPPACGPIRRSCGVRASYGPEADVAAARLPRFIVRARSLIFADKG